MNDALISNHAQRAVWAAWEARSRGRGMAMEGVMIKSFPRVLNEILHTWQLDHLLALIPSGTDTSVAPVPSPVEGLRRRPEFIEGTSLRLLDIGCGYGRISHPIAHHRPQVQAVGIDLAYPYTRRFAGNGRSCSAAQVRIPQVPFDAATFDFVIAVGVLGYLSTPALRRQALEEMLRVLKRRGLCVLITEEPVGRRVWGLGGALQLVGRLAGRGQGPENSAHTALPLDELRDEIRAAGGQIVRQMGCPTLTASLPALIPMALVSPRAARSLAHACLRIDHGLGEPPWPSIYTVSVIAKER